MLEISVLGVRMKRREISTLARCFDSRDRDVRVWNNRIFPLSTEREREKRNASVPRLINKNFMERISRKFSPFVRLVLSFIYIYA